jgi:hypothetical protein
LWSAGITYHGAHVVEMSAVVENDEIAAPLGIGDVGGAGATRLKWGGDQGLHGLHVMFAAMGVVVTWLGQASFRFDVGERRILIDPFFAEKLRLELIEYRRPLP